MPPLPDRYNEYTPLLIAIQIIIRFTGVVIHIVSLYLGKSRMISKKGDAILTENLLGKRLKELRIVYNFSQDYVAEVIGKTRQTYSHYETGRRNPSTATLYKLAALYNVSVDDLLHLSMSFNENEFYEAPGPSRSSDNLADYLEYFNNPHNHKKYQYHSNLEKELLYYFQKMSEEDKKELIEISKIKANKTSR